ncbi:MAG TPA: hypothetical protein VH518_22385 [Tepidisphaeraceae bacterium]|jgi:DNA-directed RNA polymerase subunit RPC12/RpoP
MLLLVFTILAQEKKPDTGTFWCMFIGVVIVLAAIISAGKNQPIRCKRCGYRAKKNQFRGGRCPNCDSLEA